MNAIIALCHFCDHHGPTTLFCTQAFKYSDYQCMNANKLSENFGIYLESAPPEAHSPNVGDQENKILKTAGSLNSTETVQISPKCKACHAFDQNFHHYISYDNSTNISNSPNQICYLSQSSPNVSEVFALVRKACLRTLHCEVFEDPIFFDDDKNGSVIGYEFIIKDIEGRGWQRSYSLIIIMKDRIYLQHLWSFLSKQMSIIASNLKEQAERKFQKDLLDRGLSPTGNQAQILSFKKSSKQVRGLIELTDDPLIFAKLHMWFTWILRMCSCQISEEFMHGPLSEDLQVKCEREKLRELSIDESESQKFGLLMIGMFPKDPFENNDCKPLLQIENNEDLNRTLCDFITIDSLRQLFKVSFYFKIELV